MNPLNQLTKRIKRGGTLPGITGNLTFFPVLTYQPLCQKNESAQNLRTGFIVASWFRGCLYHGGCRYPG